MNSQFIARRVLLVTAILAGAALFLKTRTMVEHVPPRLGFSGFPVRVADWDGRDLPIDSETRESLGTGDFLSRTYSGTSHASVELFMAYFPSQRTGNTIHSPKNCLPGSGWTPLQSGHIKLTAAKGVSVSVNRYVIAKGADQDVVLYWYQAHNRVVASEFSAKIYLVADALRMNRTDGSLVRVVAPVVANEPLEVAQSRAISFAEALIPQLDPYIPR